MVAKSKERKNEVPMDRRASNERRKTGDRRQQDVEVKVERRKEARRKQPRRRQIDPTTCERDYNQQEIEFMKAMDDYKRLSGRMFPTCSEILEVIHKLGYRQIADIQEVYNPEETEQKATADSAETLEEVG